MRFVVAGILGVLYQRLFQIHEGVLCQIVFAVAGCVLGEHLRAHVLVAALGPIEGVLELLSNILLEVGVIFRQFHERHQDLARFYVQHFGILEHKLIILRVTLLNKLPGSLQLLVDILDLFFYGFELHGGGSRRLGLGLHFRIF